MQDPEELLADHLGLLRGYVRRRLGAKIRSKETSLDLVQSVCREALDDLSRFEDRGEGSFRRWLFTRAENKIRDRGRFWGRERRAVDREVPLESGPAEEQAGPEPLASYDTPDQRAAAREDLARLESAFADLPEDYREVLVLSKLEGLTGAEVAQRIGRSQSATRTLLCRALARLGTALEEGT